MDDEHIVSLLRRLARPAPSGDRVIERAAMLAAGADFAAVVRWIEANGGRAEERVPAAPSGGLHATRTGGHGAESTVPRRFLIPAEALEQPESSDAPTTTERESP